MTSVRGMTWSSRGRDSASQPAWPSSRPPLRYVAFTTFYDEAVPPGRWLHPWLYTEGSAGRVP
jgi:hypothetical protein